MKLFAKFLLLVSLFLLLGQAFSMQVQFKTASGKIFKLDVKPSDTIAIVKQNFKDTYGIAPNKQRLTFNNIFLEDNYTIQHYKIPENATIDITFLLRGA